MSIILAIFVAFFVGMAESLFVNDKPLFAKVEDANGKSTRTTLSDEGWMKTGIIAALVFFANWLSPKLGGYEWVAVILLAVMVGIYGYLAYWWKQEGSSLKEMVPFLFLMALLFFTFKSVVSVVTGLSQSGLLTSVLMMLPTFFTIASIGFYVVNLLFFERDEAKDVGDKNRAKNLNIFGWIAAIIFILLLVGCFFKFCWGTLGLPSEANNGPWYTFRNTELQSNDDESDDFNFGRDLKDAADEQTEESDEADEAEVKELTAEDYDKDFRAFIYEDPKGAAAEMAWVDVNLKTRFLGVFYEECENNWATTMNAAAESWMEDEESFRKSLKTFYAFLDTAESVELKNGDGIKDQMYMLPGTFTASGVPDIIVMETEQEEGLFLVYNFRIKGTLISVAFRTECGYQPTNVAELMDITPQKNPNKPTPTPTPTNPTPTPTDPTPTPTPTPTTPSNPKDPEKSPDGPIFVPNDDKGDGPTTGTIVPDESINLPTYEDYEDAIDELDDINDEQREGGDPNTPSYTPPPEVYDPDREGINIDNNGDSGTGNGGIDVPTPVTPPAETVGGEDVTDPGAGGSWGGPPD